MAIQTHCPGCQSRFELGDQFAGKTVRCSKCNGTFQVPKPAPANIPVLEIEESAPIQAKPAPAPARKPVPRRAETNAADFDVEAPPKPQPRRAPRRRYEEEEDIPVAEYGEKPQHNYRTGNIVALSMMGGLTALTLIFGGWLTVRANNHRATREDELAHEDWERNQWKRDNEATRQRHHREFQANQERERQRKLERERDAQRRMRELERERNRNKDIKRTDSSRVPPIRPVPPPVFKRPTIVEETNSVAAKTQLGLKPVNTFDAPIAPVKMAYSPKHSLLFLLAQKELTVIDAKTGKVLGKQTSKNNFSDLDITPDQKVLFVADSNFRSSRANGPAHYIHRFDLSTQQWLTRKAPRIAYRLEAVDTDRFLLLESNQWVDVTINQWKADKEKVQELARAQSEYGGDIEYDFRIGRMYHGKAGTSSNEISTKKIFPEQIVRGETTGTYGTAKKGGGTTVLSVDGKHFYYGTLQVDAMNIKTNLHTFPERIHAAARDLAFGEKAYYNAHTSEQVDTLPYTTKVYALDTAGNHLWAYNPTEQKLHHYVLIAKP